MGIKRACKLDAEGKKKNTKEEKRVRAARRSQTAKVEGTKMEKKKKEKEKPSRIGWKGSQMFLVPVVGC